jgi:hypothetical protein
MGPIRRKTIQEPEVASGKGKYLRRKTIEEPQTPAEQGRKKLKTAVKARKSSSVLESPAPPARAKSGRRKRETVKDDKSPESSLRASSIPPVGRKLSSVKTSSKAGKAVEVKRASKTRKAVDVAKPTRKKKSSFRRDLQKKDASRKFVKASFGKRAKVACGLGVGVVAAGGAAIAVILGSSDGSEQGSDLAQKNAELAEADGDSQENEEDQDEEDQDNEEDQDGEGQDNDEDPDGEGQDSGEEEDEEQNSPTDKIFADELVDKNGLPKSQMLVLKWLASEALQDYVSGIEEEQLDEDYLKSLVDGYLAWGFGVFVVKSTSWKNLTRKDLKQDFSQYCEQKRREAFLDMIYEEAPVLKLLLADGDIERSFYSGNGSDFEEKYVEGMWASPENSESSSVVQDFIQDYAGQFNNRQTLVIWRVIESLVETQEALSDDVKQEILGKGHEDMEGSLFYKWITGDGFTLTSKPWHGFDVAEINGSFETFLKARAHEIVVDFLKDNKYKGDFEKTVKYQDESSGHYWLEGIDVWDQFRTASHHKKFNLGFPLSWLKKSVLDEHGNVVEAQGDLVTSLEFKSIKDGYTIKYIRLQDNPDENGNDVTGKMDDNDKLWIYIGCRYGIDQWYEFGFKDDGKLGYHNWLLNSGERESDREKMFPVGVATTAQVGDDMGHEGWTIELTALFSEIHRPLYFGEEDVISADFASWGMSVALV